MADLLYPESVRLRLVVRQYSRILNPGKAGHPCAVPKLVWPGHSRRSVPTNRSAKEFACGGRAGVLITRVPLPAKTPSNAVVNLPSRSRIRNLNLPAGSVPMYSLDECDRRWRKQFLGQALTSFSEARSAR